MISLLLAVATSYLVGAIPFSFIAGKLRAGIDLRQVGSGNLGATNTFRALGARSAGVVLALDMLKGVLAPIVFAKISLDSPVTSAETLATLCGVAAILGHMFPVYLSFRGGKGIATSTGVFLALNPMALLAGFVVFWLVFGLSGGIVSLGSLMSALTIPVAMFVIGKAQGDLDSTRLLLVCLIVLVLWLRHRSNIMRLLRRNEKSVFAGRRASSVPRSPS